MPKMMHDTNFGLPQIPMSQKDVYKLGILGGTFNPVHFGHLSIAEAAIQQLALNSLVLIPAGNPNFKQDMPIASGQDRLAMVKLALAEHPCMSVSDIEIRRSGITYTVDTLKELQKSYPLSVEFYFIGGADALSSVLQWKEAERIADLAHLVLAQRQGHDAQQVQHLIQTHLPHADVTRILVPEIAVSSSEIRMRCMMHESIQAMTPDAVVSYIRQHRLYQRHEAK